MSVSFLVVAHRLVVLPHGSFQIYGNYLLRISRCRGPVFSHNTMDISFVDFYYQVIALTGGIFDSIL